MTALYGYCDSAGKLFFMAADSLNGNDEEKRFCKKVSLVGSRFVVGVLGSDLPDMVLTVMEASKQKFDFKDMQSLVNYLAAETRRLARELFPMYYQNLTEQISEGKTISLADYFEQTSTLLVIDLHVNKIAKFDLGKPYCKDGFDPTPYCWYLAPNHMHFLSYAGAFEGLHFRKLTTTEQEDLVGFFKAHVTKVADKYSSHVGAPGSVFLKSESRTLEEHVKKIGGEVSDAQFDLLSFFKDGCKTEGEAKTPPPKTEFWEGA